MYSAASPSDLSFLRRAVFARRIPAAASRCSICALIRPDARRFGLNAFLGLFGTASSGVTLERSPGAAAPRDRLSIRIAGSDSRSRNVSAARSRGVRCVSSNPGSSHFVSVAGIDACSNTRPSTTVPFAHPRRNQHRRHADAQTVEVEWLVRFGVLRLRDEAVRRARGRRHVIVDPSVLVVGDEERRGRPQRGILPDGVVNRRDEALALEDVMVGVLVGGQQVSAVTVVVVKFGSMKE